MAKKRKRQPSAPRKPSAAPRFAVGRAVRVKPGVVDPDLPDRSIAGWSGDIVAGETDGGQRLWLVQWDERTRKKLPPGYEIRCEERGLDPFCMWLKESELESSDAKPIPPLRPLEQVIRISAPADPEARLRAIFGLPDGDALPPVDKISLRQFHQHLKRELTFPMEATIAEDEALPSCRVRVTALLPAARATLDTGLLCEVRRESVAIVMPLAGIDPVGGSDYQSLRDYIYWYRNWQEDDGDADEFEYGISGDDDEEALDPTEFVGQVPLGTLYLTLGALGMVGGGIVGAAVGSRPEAITAVQIGAIAFGIAGCVLGVVFGSLASRLHETEAPALCGALTGAFIGIAGGGLVGAMLTTPAGSCVGALLGAIAMRWISHRETKATGTFFGAVLGALIGSGVQSYLREGDILSAACISAVGAALALPTLGFAIAIASQLFDKYWSRFR